MSVFVNIIDKIYSPATIFLGLLGTFVTIIITLINIFLKTNRQKALIRNQTIKSQINLIKLFVELMNIIDGRQKTEISKEFIEGIINKITSINNEEEINKAIDYIKKNAYFSQPIGKASQNAIASAMYYFGIKYDILLEPALMGLKELNGITINVSSENLTMLEEKLAKLKSKQK